MFGIARTHIINLIHSYFRDMLIGTDCVKPTMLVKLKSNTIHISQIVDGQYFKTPLELDRRDKQKPYQFNYCTKTRRVENMRVNFCCCIADQ